MLKNNRTGDGLLFITERNVALQTCREVCILSQRVRAHCNI